MGPGTALNPRGHSLLDATYRALGYKSKYNTVFNFQAHERVSKFRCRIFKVDCFLVSYYLLTLVLSSTFILTLKTWSPGPDQI
jgi:hypothetical protein